MMRHVSYTLTFEWSAISHRPWALRTLSHIHMNLTDLYEKIIREWDQPRKCKTCSNTAIVLIIDGSILPHEDMQDHQLSQRSRGWSNVIMFFQMVGDGRL